MKAILQDRYGSSELLRVGAVPVPQPREGQLLIRVKAASIRALQEGAFVGKVVLTIP